MDVFFKAILNIDNRVIKKCTSNVDKVLPAVSDSRCLLKILVVLKDSSSDFSKRLQHIDLLMYPGCGDTHCKFPGRKHNFTKQIYECMLYERIT